MSPLCKLFIYFSSLLSPAIRIAAYIASFGIDLSWIGLPKYSFGSMIITSMENMGIDFAFVPIPSISNSALLMSIGKKKTKYHKNKDTGAIEEEIYSNINITVDHRFFDGSYAAKLNEEFKSMIEELDEKYLFGDSVASQKNN